MSYLIEWTGNEQAGRRRGAGPLKVVSSLVRGEIDASANLVLPIFIV